MEMRVLQRDDDITYVALVGRLDTTGVEEIEASFSNATAARKRPAVVDLAEMEFMASRGIAMLVTASKNLKQAGHELVLLKPRELVQGVLESTMMDKVVPIVHDPEEAIRIARGGQAEVGAPSPRPKTPTEQRRPKQEASVSTLSPPKEGSMKLAIKNELAELERLSDAARQFLSDHSVPSKASYAVNVAIDELVVNVMRYAYVDAETHLIDVELAVEGDQAILRIVDDGRPFDPRRGPSLDWHAEDREVGGLGLMLVLDMVDVLRYQRVEEENRVEVRIRLIPEDQSGESAEAGSPEASAP
jgi:serine/threonine-protein kinase RsbW